MVGVGGPGGVSVYRVEGCVSTDPCLESQRAFLPGNPWQQLLLLSHFLLLSSGGGSSLPTG